MFVIFEDLENEDVTLTYFKFAVHVIVPYIRFTFHNDPSQLVYCCIAF